MSLGSYKKVDGVRYSTPQQAQAARRARSMQQISQRRGLKGKLGDFFMTPETRKRIGL